MLQCCFSDDPCLAPSHVQTMGGADAQQGCPKGAPYVAQRTPVPARGFPPCPLEAQGGLAPQGMEENKEPLGLSVP